MKKVLSLMMVLALLCSCIAIPASAQETVETIVEYLEDGSYFETVIEETPSLRAGGTKTGSKTATYYNSNDVPQWYVKVTGSFTYTGLSAFATAASYNVGYYVSGCTIGNSGSYTANNNATAYTTVSYGGSSNYRAVTLSCSANGSLY